VGCREPGIEVERGEDEFDVEVTLFIGVGRIKLADELTGAPRTWLSKASMTLFPVD
jgi:hypothetical protein